MSGTNVPKNRWKMLAAAIAKANQKAKTADDDELESVSVMRFKNFGLVKSSALATEEADKVGAKLSEKLPFPVAWFEYSCPDFPAYRPLISHISKPTSIEAMMGFNNTGNVCVWPSEEVLAYYVMKNATDFDGKTVCELGAGMAGLAGFAVAMCSDAQEVLLTDGNEDSVANLNACAHVNSGLTGRTKLDVASLVWDRSDSYDTLSGHFDMIICADCLFFTDVHIDLAHVLTTLLKPDGVAIIVGPSRSGTLEQFSTQFKDELCISQTYSIDPVVENCHLEALNRANSNYDEDLHRPILLKLRSRHGS